MSNGMVFNEVDDLKQLEKQLDNLQQRYSELSEALNQTTNDEEILKYKYELKKLKDEDIPHIQNKINSLIQKQRKNDGHKQKLEEEKKRKEKLVQELYVNYDNKVLRELCNYSSLRIYFYKLKLIFWKNIYYQHHKYQS